MKKLKLWDGLLLAEAVIFILFIVFVALEFCSSNYTIDTSLGSEVRKTIYLFVLMGSGFRLVSIICHVFLILPEYCRVFVVTLVEETTNLVFITGLSLQIVFLVQIYYALLGLAQPKIRKVFIVVIMSSYVISFFLIFLCLFYDVDIVLDGLHCTIALLCLFCLVALLGYGFQIYKEMKQIAVVKTVIRKMITIMLISSITFAFRAIIECLFLFDVIVLDFDETTNGNMHVIGSHLYASSMYFFFFYFLAEINPLSILLLSTYIKPQARPKYPSQRKEKSPYTQSTTKVGNLAQRLFSRKSRDSTDESRVALLSSPCNQSSIDIQLSSHLNTKKTV
ncbi:hypothetical protein WA538_000132 [Blastocystis sp. DL]